MALSAVSFALMAALVKAASPRIPSQEIVALRGLAAFLFVVVMMVWRRIPLRIHRPGGLLLRALLGYGAISCWFFAIGRLSLPDAVMIQYTSPVFVALLAPLVLGERPRRKDLVALAIALVGVVLVVQPGVGVDAAGALVGLAGAVCSAVAYMFVRWLRHHEHPLIIMASFPALAALIGLIVAMPDWVWPRGGDAWALAGICLLTVTGQLGLTFGLVWERAGPASVATYVAVALSVPLGVFGFGEQPSPLMLLGAALVVGSVASLAVTTHRPVPPPEGAGGSQVAGAAGVKP